jgi:tetratricopeptide (TPR) repeat protein
MGHLKILTVCAKFVPLLCQWKPRPTILFPIVYRVNTSRSPLATVAKFTCFYKLSSLALTLFNFIEVIRVQEAAYDLSKKVGEKNIMLLSTCMIVYSLHLLGQHGKGLELAQRAQEITKGKRITPFFRGALVIGLAYTQECVDVKATGSSVSNLFYESARSLREGGDSWNSNAALAEGHLAFALIDNNITLARSKLKEMYDMVHTTKDRLVPHISFYLASAYFLEGNFKEADCQLIEAREACKLDEMMPFASIILLIRALLAASLGPSHVDEARDLIAQAKEEAGTYSFVSHVTRWVTLYASGVVEFAAGQMDEAHIYFQEAKVYCKAHDEFRFRAFSTRAMGEIAYMQGNHSEADPHFQETWDLCKDAGIIPSLLYRPSFFVFCRHSGPATCEGWPRFLEKLPSMVW